MKSRLPAQLSFLIEADKLKSVTRANLLADGSRFENAAEHSWHLCLWALVFADQSQGANISRVIQMLLIHKLLRIDTPDDDVTAAQAAADRLFGLLPEDQATSYRVLWEDFAEGKTTDARYARNIDIAQPMFLELANPAIGPAERDSLHALQTTGRFATLKDDWPVVYDHAVNLLNRRTRAPMEPLAARLRFLIEADALKTVLRGTTLCDGTRRENSAEHSWHIMLWALTLQEHSHRPVRIDTVLLMLLLHDIVEIDAGDNPLHGNFDAALVEAQEQAAADRLFGLLPSYQRDPYRAIWEEFEAATTPEAVFAKSLDRAQPLVCNLESGGGSWRAYNVTRAQLEDRVAIKVKRGAPAVWNGIAPRIDAWFDANATV
ncbi:MAG: HD domain-containing protein [Octadecabacter sp.]|nr:HD domain-containing protein [Octadecabacter sp.]